MGSSLLPMASKPLKIGTRVPYYGHIEGIALTGGERYYFLVDKHGGVALMPAADIEEMVRERDTRVRVS